MGVYDQEIWEKLNENMIESFLDEVNPSLEPIPFFTDTTSVKYTDLSFYDEYDLYQLKDYDAVPTVEKFLLYKKGSAIPITWTNEGIYNLNKSAPVILTDETIIDYVKFFFHYVRGRHGRFTIVEHVDDINWKEAPISNTRKALNEMIKTVEIIGKSMDGNYKLSANMVFKDSLFKSTILIDKNGRVSLTDEEILVEAMPVFLDMSS